MEWDKLDHAVIAAATGQWRRRPGVPAVDILSTVSDLLNHCTCNDFCCFIKGCVSNDSCSFCCLLMSFIYLFISLIHQQSYQTVAAKGIQHADGKARPTGTYSFPDKLSIKTNTYSLHTTGK